MRGPGVSRHATAAPANQVELQQLMRVYGDHVVAREAVRLARGTLITSTRGTLICLISLTVPDKPGEMQQTTRS